ncbi:hypothetical protein ACOSQ4_004561 [Xanthoceras sorbifolium]
MKVDALLEGSVRDTPMSRVGTPSKWLREVSEDLKVEIDALVKAVKITGCVSWRVSHVVVTKGSRFAGCLK